MVNTSDARDTDKGGKAESPCCGGQRFTAGLLINQSTDQLNTMEAAKSPIWCDICQAGFGVRPVFSHCCPEPVILQEVKSGHLGLRAPAHAEHDTQWLINIS